MPRQKWSGVKLTKKEKEEIRREERAELLAEVIGFLIVLGFFTFIAIAITLMFGGGK